MLYILINVRENRKGNQEWKFQRNGQHRRRQIKKTHTAQYVLDITIHKQTQRT